VTRDFTDASGTLAVVIGKFYAAFKSADLPASLVIYKSVQRLSDI
jgi:hypothetical protein